ncbi:MAG: hypothetical protein H6858_03585 [Rhodospirillales bacterium]|nr:hypothetical protein [Alphaproteobacteria bacterium]MCB1840023.1 hypothetical protein [Alphaproteobacteria bacterium]MCB9976666.1 hypothetical protein [Rhodospirillales bacterium]
MFNGSLSHSGVNASFEKNEKGCPHIRFFDPAYVRSETIVFQPETRDVHAVLHESLIYIGQVPEAYAEAFAAFEDVLLSADHYSGKPVCLKAKIARPHV